MQSVFNRIHMKKDAPYRTWIGYQTRCHQSFMAERMLLVCLSLIGLLLSVGCDKPHSDPKSALRTAGTATLSSFDPPTATEKSLPAATVKFEQANLAQVLSLYAEVSGRSVILGMNVPDVKITFSNQTPMRAVEVLQALDTVLAAQGIMMVFLGTQYVKVVPAKEAHLESGPVVELEPSQLPESSSFLTYIVTLKNVTPAQVMPALSPFSKLPNSILVISSGGSKRTPSNNGIPNLPVIFGAKDRSILILRDYSSNVRRMLQVLEKLEEQ